MRIYTFEAAKGRKITAFNSQGAVISRLTSGPRSWQIVALYLEPDGVLGAHRATSDQLLVVTQGTARVSTGKSKPMYAGPGSAVFWRSGEEHETRAGPEGLLGIIIEGDGLADIITMQLQRG
jgi:quercetin dioxygenase-like cupin family protein